MTQLFWITILIFSGRWLPVTTGAAVLPVLPAGNTGSNPATGSYAGPQGIEGVVYSVSGNRMPSPNRKTGLAYPRGVKSTIYVFELTNISQVTRQEQSSYYPAVNTKLVKQADTNDSGFFKIELPPGLYSVFTRKGDLFYASRRDEKNNIAPVEVVAGKFTRIDCKIEGDRRPVY